MSTLWLTVALCVGPPAEATRAAPATPADDLALAVDRQSSPGDLRAACAALMRQSAPRGQPELAQVVPQLVSLYEIVGEAEQLGPAGKRRLQQRLTARLEQIQQKLLRESSRVRRTGRQSTRLSAGPATPGAQALIDLIQTTVAPSSWEINGGLGTICYFPRYQALVIRQSQAAHRKIGGALQNVRP